MKFSFNGTNQNCFKYYGHEHTTKNYLSNDIQKGNTAISSYTKFLYSHPQWIRLCEEDHPYHLDDPWAAESIDQITRLEYINGNSATMKDEASKQYTVSRNTSIRPVTPIMNIGIENMFIKRENTGSPGGGELGTSVIFKNAVNCWVKGVRFEQTCKHHIMISYSSHIRVSGCYFHDARSFEAGGYG